MRLEKGADGENAMKRKIINGMIVLLLILGCSSVLYPAAVRYYADLQYRKVIDSVDQRTLYRTDSDSESARRLEHLYEEMTAYNKRLYEEGQAGLKDPFFYEDSAFNLEHYGIEDEIAGYITVPRMEIAMPIYFGAVPENMAMGAANLGNTSVPIGSVNTNTVLAAHRGYRGIPMFQAIEQLQKGDRIYITNLWETLTYEVRETMIIEPTDIWRVRIQEGKNMVTLLTCHPYTQNYQRYLVYCDQVEGESDPAAVTAEETGFEFKYVMKFSEMSSSQRLIFAERWGGVVFLILLLCISVGRILLRYIRKRK